MRLDAIALAQNCDKSSQFHAYCDVYHDAFVMLRYENFAMLEVGVQTGASIRMWLEYFPKAIVHGVDIDPATKFEAERFVWHEGDQSNPAFWQGLLEGPLNHLSFRIVVDDGSHVAAHAIATFSELWPRVEPGGFYVVEDVFCWFFYDIWDVGDLGKQWLAGLLSAVNLGGKYFHGNPGTVPPDQELTDLEKTVESVEFHKGLVIIRKRVGSPNLL